MTSSSTTPIHYETSWLLHEAGARSHVTDVLQDLRRRYDIENRQVVELGSGIGTNLLSFSSGNSVLGVEGMPSAVEESNRRGIAAVQANLAEPLDLADTSADWILCIDVLEHLVNPAQCLANAHRVLRDDGWLVINVPNHFDWRGRLRVLRGSGIDSQHYFQGSPHWEYPHLRFFGRRSIEDLLQATGFQVHEDLGPRFLSFPKAHWWRSIGLRSGMESIRARWPDLLTSGFFLLCRKHDQQ